LLQQEGRFDEAQAVFQEALRHPGCEQVIRERAATMLNIPGAR
jgi:Tfp pilus assembly protein PilF